MRVEDKNLNEIRFRSDVYKMLSEPGKSAPYAIPDTKFDNFSEREFEEKVATSIILRLMEVSASLMIHPRYRLGDPYRACQSLRERYKT